MKKMARLKKYLIAFVLVACCFINVEQINACTTSDNCKNCNNSSAESACKAQLKASTSTTKCNCNNIQDSAAKKACLAGCGESSTNNSIDTSTTTNQSASSSNLTTNENSSSTNNTKTNNSTSASNSNVYSNKQGAENTYSHEVVVCGNIDSEYGIPSGVAKFTRAVYSTVKILVPIIIIILGMLDFAKAVMANADKDMKEYKNKFMRRLIAGVLIFFVLSVVNFAFRQIGTTDSDSMLGCLSCFTTTEDSCSTYVNGSKKFESKKTCSEYSSGNGCPSKAENGNTCKTITPSNSDAKCVQTCNYLGMSNCGSRSDCYWNGSQSSGTCKSK